MSKNTGTPSERIFVATLEKYWRKKVFIFRLADAAAAFGRTGRLGLKDKQPSDYIITENGEMYYAEMKSSTDKSRFALKNISSGQIGAAKRQIAAGGKYYFYLHQLSDDRWFKVPAQVLLDTNKSSIRWDELGSYAWELYNEVHGLHGGSGDHRDAA